MPYSPDRIDRILFAEDDSAIRSVFTEMLCIEGFDVTAVESGDQAAVVLETNLLLTDVRMPGTLRLIRRVGTRVDAAPEVVAGEIDALPAKLRQIRWARIASVMTSP